MELLEQKLNSVLGISEMASNGTEEEVTIPSFALDSGEVIDLTVMANYEWDAPEAPSMHSEGNSGDFRVNDFRAFVAGTSQEITDFSVEEWDRLDPEVLEAVKTKVLGEAEPAPSKSYERPVRNSADMRSFR